MAERRPELLDAALSVIVERGYRGATLDAVAARAGVTKPVIYSVFSNRDAFFAALLDREEQRALTAIAAAMPASGALAGSDRAALRRSVATGIAGLLRAVEHDPSPWRLILAATEATPGPVRERIHRDRGLIYEGVHRLVADGLAAAGADGLDAGLLAHALFGAVERLIRLAAEKPGVVDPDRAGDVIVALLST